MEKEKGEDRFQQFLRARTAQLAATEHWLYGGGDLPKMMCQTAAPIVLRGKKANDVPSEIQIDFGLKDLSC